MDRRASLAMTIAALHSRWRGEREALRWRRRARPREDQRLSLRGELPVIARSEATWQSMQAQSHGSPRFARDDEAEFDLALAMRGSASRW